MDKLNTINIKGKDYVRVVDRLKFFREKGLWKDWTIQTQYQISDDWQEVIFTAEVYDGEGELRATGHAHESRNNGSINRQNFIENAETSAVGRALGMLNIGLTDEFCSADELLIKNIDSFNGPDGDVDPLMGGPSPESKDTDGSSEVNRKLNEVIGGRWKEVNRWCQEKYGLSSYLELSHKIKINIIERPAAFFEKVKKDLAKSMGDE